jgi:hypothetical protein
MSAGGLANHDARKPSPDGIGGSSIIEPAALILPIFRRRRLLLEGICVEKRQLLVSKQLRGGLS